MSDRVLYEAAPAVPEDPVEAIGELLPFAKAVRCSIRLSLRCRHIGASVVSLSNALTGYAAVIENLPFGSRRTADLRGLYDLFRRLEREGGGDVFGTVRYMRELIQTGTVLPRPHLEVGDAVSLMTIHMAKGLEWSVVFVPDRRIGEFLCSSDPLDPFVGLAFSLKAMATIR